MDERLSLTSQDQKAKARKRKQDQFEPEDHSTSSQLGLLDKDMLFEPPPSLRNHDSDDFMQNLSSESPSSHSPNSTNGLVAPELNPLQHFNPLPALSPPQHHYETQPERPLTPPMRIFVQTDQQSKAPLFSSNMQPIPHPILRARIDRGLKFQHVPDGQLQPQLICDESFRVTVAIQIGDNAAYVATKDGLLKLQSIILIMQSEIQSQNQKKTVHLEQFYSPQSSSRPLEPLSLQLQPQELTHISIDSLRIPKMPSDSSLKLVITLGAKTKTAVYPIASIMSISLSPLISTHDAQELGPKVKRSKPSSFARDSGSLQQSAQFIRQILAPTPYSPHPSINKQQARVALGLGPEVSNEQVLERIVGVLAQTVQELIEDSQQTNQS